jgi:hypothetical protein
MAKRQTKPAPKTKLTKSKAKPRPAPVIKAFKLAPDPTPAAADPAPDPALIGTSVVGRPTKYRPEIVQALTDAISAGMNVEQACARADISDSTFQNWRKLAEAGDQRFWGFLEALTRARGSGIRSHLQVIQTAGSEGFSVTETIEITEQKLTKNDEVVTLTKTTKVTRNTPPDWKASAFWLERVEAKQFGPTQKNELSGPGGGKIPVEITSHIDRIYGGKKSDDEGEK